ncbi:MAG: preprotein translocase subunit YajC [Deltaproteobacteria bacterium]|nr:preprotein translocase subunit YajC [Deltaproteobacteria bacterium]MBW1793350.1 preprotein translocase subunit YajC [Deltaproteobacteria bacterium]MBW2331277.1 preprotein translocase subunit YajC [Deltaproteobacteria bacterium]
MKDAEKDNRQSSITKEVFILIDIVYAMGTGGGTSGEGGGFGAFAPLILMFVIFYFLLIRPQQKKQKQHRQMLGSIKKGDRVITSGGLYGRITGLTDTVVTLEISEKVRVKVGRSNIAGLAQSENPNTKKS